MKNNINQKRRDFYLDIDGTSRWEYVELVESDMATYGDLSLGVCHVCGKTPIKYNFVLRYRGTEAKNISSSGLASVGSECIAYMDRTTQMKMERDAKAVFEKHKKENGIIFGKYLKEILLPEHPEIFHIRWEYSGKPKNLGSSVIWLSEKCMSGIPLHESTFGKSVKRILESNNIMMPDMREIKKMLGETFNTNHEAKKTGYEELPSVPDGMELQDIYGISPITGKRDIVYVRLLEHGKVMDQEPDVIRDWNPIIDVPGTVKTMHLQDFLFPSDSQLVLKALQIIAGYDPDMAEIKNKMGFSKPDVEFGHSLASRDFLTENQLHYAKKMVWKYRRQLPKEIIENIFGAENGRQ